jgi:hypothetical protein
MAVSKGGGRPPVKGDNSNRPNGKAWKKFIKQYDPERKKLVRVLNPAR